jgi:hypothetical protein
MHGVAVKHVDRGAEVDATHQSSAAMFNGSIEFGLDFVDRLLH